MRTGSPLWGATATRLIPLVDGRFGSRKAFASALDEQEPTVSNWLNGKRCPPLDTIAKMARLLEVPLGTLLGESPAPAPAVPMEAIEQAERVAREALELAQRLRGTAGQPSAPSPTPVQPGGVREDVLPFRPRPPITLYQAEPDLDEPQEERKTEVPIVAFLAAGTDRNVAESPTGETVRILNPKARLVLEGKRFVSRVVGTSMEPDFPEGTLVLFERVSPTTVRRGAVVFINFEGQLMLKVIDFKDREGHRLVGVRFVSSNGPDLYPREDGDYALLGRAVEKVADVQSYSHLLDRR